MLTPALPVTIRTPVATKVSRVGSIDLLRGGIMIIMALDHVRDYFHRDAFLYSPTDLSQTNVPLFFTRWITHYCAPAFVFLAGISAYLYGVRKGRDALSFFLWTRGLWLIFLELFVLSLVKSFNPTYPYFTLQVIWAIGVCMIALSSIIYLKPQWILLTGILLVAFHNLLDKVHVPDNSSLSFFWSVMHEPRQFSLGPFTINVLYPVLAWIGVMALGYSIGKLYAEGYDQGKRRKQLLYIGIGAIVLFVILRLRNLYGDPVDWNLQTSSVFSLLSYLNVNKYPPSLLYILVTLGPALVCLSLSERPVNKWTARISVFGRVAMFYYLVHFLAIHAAAAIGAILQGYKFQDMVLNTPVYTSPQLEGYGFNLWTVYIVWIALIFALYPLCKWFDNYKRSHVARYWWLSYL